MTHHVVDFSLAEKCAYKLNAAFALLVEEYDAATVYTAAIAIMLDNMSPESISNTAHALDAQLNAVMIPPENLD